MENIERRKYLDNIRVICILLVVIFHVIDIFNSAGSIVHYNAPGIAALDTIGYAVYPWFMAILFAVSGAAAKYSLEKRGIRGFIRERTKKLLLPFIVYMLTLSPLTAAFSFSSQNAWSDFEGVPAPVMYIIMVCIGMGHLWFIAELYLTSLFSLLIYKFDKKCRLVSAGKKAGVLLLIFLAVPLYFSAQFGNFLEVMRFPFYLLMYLLGFYVFSSGEVLKKLSFYKIPLLIGALLLLPIQIYFSFGKSFSVCVNDLFPLVYSWIVILAVFAFYKEFSFSSGFFEYLNEISFSIYLFHYIPMIAAAYLFTEYLKLPVLLNYAAVFIAASAASIAISELFRRIPGLRFLFGIKPYRRKSQIN